MKALMTSVCCVAILFVLTSCNQEPDLEDYGVEKVERSLSDGEIESCFDVLGLRFERFRCMIPKRTRINFGSQQYIKGKARRGESSGTIYVDKGLQEFTMFMKQESDSVSFSVQASGGRAGCGSASVEDYSAKTWGWIPIKKLSKEKQPIFLYAANAGGIEGFSTDRIDIGPLVNKYDFAMVIYVRIENQP